MIRDLALNLHLASGKQDGSQQWSPQITTLRLLPLAENMLACLLYMKGWCFLSMTGRQVQSWTKIRPSYACGQ